MKLAALIPTYQPADNLPGLLKNLVRLGFRPVLLVDDGSDPRHDALFKKIKKIPHVQILTHAVNLGKGAALKTGLNHLAVNHPRLLGVVTVDADGQHLPQDAGNIAESFLKEPTALLLGTRRFDSNTPFRSRIGNNATRVLLRLLAGINLRDTQTGLRAIPRAFWPTLIKLGAQGYEFELDMLLSAKQVGIKIRQREITTVYEPGNPHSHFNPLLDSTKIYFVLFRFSLAGIFASIIDTLVFLFAIASGLGVGGSQIYGRLVSMLFNYAAVKKRVFYSKQKVSRTLPLYLGLVVVSGFLAYGLILNLNRWGMPVLPAKLFAESLIFVFNFLVQRHLIFKKKSTG